VKQLVITKPLPQSKKKPRLKNSTEKAENSFKDKMWMFFGFSLRLVDAFSSCLTRASHVRARLNGIEIKLPTFDKTSWEWLKSFHQLILLKLKFKVILLLPGFLPLPSLSSVNYSRKRNFFYSIIFASMNTENIYQNEAKSSINFLSLWLFQRPPYAFDGPFEVFFSLQNSTRSSTRTQFDTSVKRPGLRVVLRHSTCWIIRVYQRESSSFSSTFFE
jgi:hypothetical protein